VRELPETLMEAGLDALGLEIVLEAPDGGIRALPVDGSDAIASWKRARPLVVEAGAWPVLLGTRAELERLGEGVLRSAAATSEILERAETLPPDPAALVAARQSALLEAMRASNLPGMEDVALPVGAPARPAGAWPTAFTPMKWTIPFDELGAPHREVLLAFVPTPVPWQVPALLRFGGSGDCPPAEEHVALLKHWSERVGAELVGMTPGKLELLVARPPADREAALALGRDLKAYCPRSARTVEELAASLLGSSVWSFRWD